MTLNFPQKLSGFLNAYPNNLKLVEDVPFKKKPESSMRQSKNRKVLVISSFGLTRAEKRSLLKNYRDLVTDDLVSFSVWERTTHLFFQNNGSFFDFGFWVIPYWYGKHITTKFYRFRQRAIRFPSSRRLEPLILVNPTEKMNVGIYLKNLAKDYKRVLGNYFDPGCQETNARLEDNRAKLGHNCTSWITTAPIGANQECLIELLGSNRAHEIGTNPGWWLHWILYSAPEERIPLVLYWSPDSLEAISEAQVKTGIPIQWDFNKK